MKAFKRIFSFLLVLSMIISTLPGYTYAQETKSNVEENVKNNAENFLANVNEEIKTQGDIIEFPIDIPGGDFERYTVLILDSSERMKGEPFELQKQAARKFCKAVSEENKEIYVAVLSMSSFEGENGEEDVKLLVNFTSDVKEVEKAIDNLPEPKGKANIAEALSRAYDMLKDIYYYSFEATSLKDPVSSYDNKNSDKPIPQPIPKPNPDKPPVEDESSKLKKHVLLLSSGLPTKGKSEEILEPYTTKDSEKNYKFGNSAINEAKKIKNSNMFLYTLGFFKNFKDEETTFAKTVMKDIASKNGNYEFENVDKLEFVFGDRENPIIIIPGVLGSRLYTKDDIKVWEPDKSTAKMLKDNILSNLEVRDIKEQHNAVNKEYGADNAYKNIVDELCKRFPKRPIYVFSYDWRQSNSESADKLNVAINKILAETGKEKVDIVAHSMGGLVTSSYYSKHGNGRIGKIITCGTPYEGSAKMFNSILNWDVVGDGLPNDWDLYNNPDWLDFHLGRYGLNRFIKIKFKGVAELIPTRNYIDRIPMRQDSIYPFNYGDYELSYDEYIKKCRYIFERGTTKGIRPIETYEEPVVKLDAIKSFQNSLLEGGYNNLLKYKNAYFILGINHKTITSVKFQTFEGEEIIRGLDERLYEIDLGYETKGDGTVPFYSSSISEQIPKLDGRRWVAFNANHGEVKDLKICIDWISDILANGVSPIKGEIPKSKPYVVVRIACPVDVTTNKNGEELSSDVKKLKINSDYGRLDIVGKNDDIKMLCLDEDKNIKIKLNGTDTGTMDYTIRYFDENNSLVDERTFKDIPVTKDTLIDTGIDKENKTVLNIDENGDGKVDKAISASKNEIINKDGKPVIFTKNIKLETPKTELKVGEEIDLSVSVEPKEANDKLKVKFKSSDEKIATVDKNGRVKALGVGKITITAETENGVFKSSVELNILGNKVNTGNDNNQNKKDNNEKTGDKVDDVKTDLDNGNKKKQNSLVKTGLSNNSSLAIISILSGLLVILASKKRKNNLIKHK